MGRFLSSLLTFSLAFSSAAQAAVAGDDPQGDWVFLDLNQSAKLPPPNEVSVARKVVAPDRVHTFLTPKQLEQWLEKNPARRVSTLVISGHASGSSFMVVGGEEFSTFKADDLAKLLEKFPALREVTAFYAMGCYTAVRSNAKLWMRAHPNVRFFAGFDGMGPSDEPSAYFLRDAEAVRRRLPAQPTLKDLSLALKSTVALRETVGVFAVRVGPMEMAYVSNASPAERVNLELRPKAACLAGFAELRGKFKDSTGILSYVFSFAPHNKTPDGATVPLLVLPPTDPNRKLRASDMSTLDAKSIAELRDLYRIYQGLSDCPPEAFAEATDLFPNQSTDVDGVVSMMVGLIHGQELTRNLLVCMRPILRASYAYFDRCGGSRAVLTDLDRLLQPSLPADSRMAVAEYVDRSAAFSPPVQLRNLQKINLLLLSTLNALGSPPHFALEPIVRPDDDRCDMLRNLTPDKFIPTLEKAKCDESLSIFPDEIITMLEGLQNGDVTTPPSPAPDASPSPEPSPMPSAEPVPSPSPLPELSPAPSPIPLPAMTPAARSVLMTIPLDRMATPLRRVR